MWIKDQSYLRLLGKVKCGIRFNHSLMIQNRTVTGPRDANTKFKLSNKKNDCCKVKVEINIIIIGINSGNKKVITWAQLINHDWFQSHMTDQQTKKIFKKIDIDFK